MVKGLFVFLLSITSLNGMESPRVVAQLAQGQEIPSLSCLAVRCLVKKTNYLSELQSEHIPINTIPCIKEVIHKELIKPFLFPFSCVQSKNSQSVHHHGVADLDVLKESNQLVSMACDGKMVFYDKAHVAHGDAYHLDMSMSALRISNESPIRIFLGGLNGNIYVMDHATKKIISEIRAHQGTLNHLALANDYVASCSNDKTVKVWDKTNGAKQQEFTDYTGSVRVVTFWDNTVLVSSSSDGCIKLLDVERGVVKASHCYARLPRIWAMDLARKNGRIMAGFNNGRISLFDANSWREIYQWPGHNELISSLAIDQDEKNFVTGSWDRCSKVWDVRMRACAAELAAHTDWVQCVCSFDNGHEVVTGSRDQMLRVWDLRMIKMLDQYTLAQLLSLAGHINEKPVPQEHKITCLHSVLEQCSADCHKSMLCCDAQIPN